MKVWYDTRGDLCNYCKDAQDGHTNAECCRRKVAAVEKVRPTIY